MSALRGATLYFDCFAGIAGDMTVAALVDLGVPELVVREALAALPVGGYSVGFARVMRGALEGAKFRVTIEHGHSHPHHHGGKPHDHGHDHVHYGEIRTMIAGAALAEGVKSRALAIFDRIARVEARIHGVVVAEVAFHEVGAVDSIVDIVAAAAALDWLRPVRVIARRVPLGRGSVQTAHGLLPVPAPATLQLLEGADVEEGGVEAELTTPTGAAILAASVSGYGELPSITVAGVGWGAGDRELPDRPNLLRVVAGHERAAASIEKAVVLEANLDDMSPELAAPLIDALLAAGARDAWLHPVIMKKGRPALVVGALVEPAARAAVEAALFRESTTIGVRWYAVERTVLPRRMVEVETPFGPVAVKVADLEGGGVSNAAPEFEACRALAERHGVPVKRVYAEALAAFFRR